MFEVEWHWKHQNHDLFSLQDMKTMRASGPLKDWLSEKVLAGMTWPTLRKLLRNSDLTRVMPSLSQRLDHCTDNPTLGSQSIIRAITRGIQGRLSVGQKLDEKDK